MPSQKALYIREERGSFTLEERSIPTPATGEILVQIKAAALNPVDWKIPAIPLPYAQYPAILGTDIAGDVVQVGEGAQGFDVGDRVLFQGWFDENHAGFQQYTNVAAEIAAKIPPSISYSQAASVPLALATATLGLFNTREGAGLNPSLNSNIKFPGQPVVIIGGATSVGQYTVQLLKYSGFSTIITYASGHQTDLLKGFGATHIIDRKQVSIQDLPAAVKKITNAPIKIVMDAVSLPDTQEAGHSIVAEGGDLLLLLDSEIKNPSESKKIHRVYGNVQPDFNRAFGRTLYKNVTKWLEDKTIVPNRTEDLPNGLAGIVDGLERLKNDQVSGLKLIALPQETP